MKDISWWNVLCWLGIGQVWLIFSFSKSYTKFSGVSKWRMQIWDFGKVFKRVHTSDRNAWWTECTYHVGSISNSSMDVKMTVEGVIGTVCIAKDLICVPGKNPLHNMPCMCRATAAVFLPVLEGYHSQHQDWISAIGSHASSDTRSENPCMLPTQEHPHNIECVSKILHEAMDDLMLNGNLTCSYGSYEQLFYVFSHIFTSQPRDFLEGGLTLVVSVWRHTWMGLVFLGHFLHK